MHKHLVEFENGKKVMKMTDVKCSFNLLSYV